MRAWASSSYDDNLRMSLRHAFIDIFETLDELWRDLLLVTNTNILQVEGLGMTSFGTHLGPLVGGRVAISPFNEVNHFVNPLVHLTHGHHVLSLCGPHVPTAISTLAAHTCRQNGYGLHTKVFAELEVLEITQSHTLVIAPCVLQLAACLLWTNGGLPTIGVPEAVATTMYYTATGEAHKLRMQIGQCLGQVLANSVSHIGILWHQ